MIYIQYPSGSHGSFLKLLVNELAGVTVQCNHTVYDDAVYPANYVCESAHFIDNSVISNNVVNIAVRPESYLKYFTMCATRTAKLNIDLDSLHIDTVSKLQKHPILSQFLTSLFAIAVNEPTSISKKYLREWFRLCFFNNDGSNIHKFIQANNRKDAALTVDFESFYNGNIINEAVNICNHFGICATVNDSTYQRINDFRNSIRHYYTDHHVNQIIKSINCQVPFEFKTNIIEQAWIDNYLQANYNKDLLLIDSYFTNTNDILSTYNLKTI